MLERPEQVNAAIARLVSRALAGPEDTVALLDSESGPDDDLLAAGDNG
jgi:hypothetical protein